MGMCGYEITCVPALISRPPTTATARREVFTSVAGGVTRNDRSCPSPANGNWNGCDFGSAFHPAGRSRRNSPEALATLALTETCTLRAADEGNRALLSGRFTDTAGTTVNALWRSPRARSA